MDFIISLGPYVKEILLKLEYFSIIFLFLANTSYLCLLIFGYLNARKKHIESISGLEDKRAIINILKPISIIVPAYNEEKSIIKTIEKLRMLDYPEFEIVVVNDGSSDNTLDVIKRKFKMVAVDIQIPNVLKFKHVNKVYYSREYPDLVIVDKQNGGKSDALNAGISISNFPLVCCVDADGIIESNGLIQLARPFFEHPDTCVATGGVIRVVNNLKVENGKVVSTSLNWNLMHNIQIVEYLRGFLVGRLGWDYLNCNTIISGAFGLFKKQSVLNVGGYDRNTIGEDFELLLRIEAYYLKNKKPHSVHFMPDPICWTEVPSDFKTLGNQRSRWQQGLSEGLWSQRSMFFKGWSKQIGNFALPYLFLFELISAPIELISYVLTIIGFMAGIFDTQIVILFFSVAVVYGWILTFGAVIIEEFTFNKYKKPLDIVKLAIGCIFEQIGYRQLNLYWRVRGMWRHLWGKKAWGEMRRTGFTKHS